MGHHTAAEKANPELERLRETWGKGWHIWATADTWLGTLTDEAAGVERTVAADTAEQLDGELARQGVLAVVVRQLVDAIEKHGGMHAEPDGHLVRITHLTTGRCGTVALLHDQETDLSWAWPYETIEPIGRADGLPTVVQKIQTRLAQPFRRA